MDSVGGRVAEARRKRGLSQLDVARRCGWGQYRIAKIETGARKPTLEQLLRLARALDVPLQWFLTGTTQPGTDLEDILLELRDLGAVDLLVATPSVPGAFRAAEHVVSLAVSGDQPDPRIVEALPALLAWNRWDPSLLRAYGKSTDKRAPVRLAWLADIALTIHRIDGFPGGCPGQRDLEGFLKLVRRPSRPDSLGRPTSDEADLAPVWKRWRITCDTTLQAFKDRAASLHESREEAR